MNLEEKYQDVVYLADVHKGAGTFNKNLYYDTLQYCLNYKVPVHLGGDIGEFAVPGSPGTSLFTQRTVQYQLDSLIRDLGPLAEKKLILGYNKGNHEDRIMKKTGVDICLYLCRILDISYLGGACWNRYKIGPEFYYVYTLHGST